MNNQSRQELYERVKAHIVAQGRPSYDPDAQPPLAGDWMNWSRCRYRLPQPDGTTLKCAAGALIADEHYRSKFEGEGCWHPDVIEALTRSGVEMSGDDDSNFLADMQAAHDRAAEEVPAADFVKEALERLARVAASWMLTP